MLSHPSSKIASSFPATIAEVISRRGATGSREFAFFTDGGASNGAEFHRAAQRVARRLLEYYSVKPGGRVVIVAPTGHNLLTALAGCWYAGLLAAPLDVGLTPAVLAQTLADIRPDIFLIDTSVDTDRRLADACAQSGSPVVPLDQLSTWPDGEVSASVRADDPALVIFTSGSTGVPKGAVLSQGNLLAGAYNIATSVELSADDRAMCVLPLSHLHGLMATFVTPLVTGGTVVFFQGTFDGRRVLHELDKYRCSWISCVPTQYAALMKPPVSRREWSLESLRFCRSASASLLPRLRRDFEEYYGIPIIETMGMTETSAQIFANPLPPAPRPDGSVGRAIGFEVRIVADDGTVLPDNKEGEIQVKGPGLMLGYLDSPEETQKTYDDEWLKSGDLGKRDASGYYYITGRKKDIAIFSGLNISLRAIESGVSDKNLVDDIGCVAGPDPHFGERITAYVVTSKVDEELPGLASLVAETIRVLLPNRQALREIRVVDRIPRTEIGKILRHKLRDTPSRYISEETLPSEPRALLAEILAIPETDIAEDLRLGSIRQWDSLAHTVIVIAVEELLGRMLEEREIFALTTFWGLVQVLEGTLAEDAPLGADGETENPDLMALMVWNHKLPTVNTSGGEIHKLQGSNVLTRQVLCDAICAAGINAGDLLMVHSDIAALGLTEGGFNRAAVLEFYLSCFQDVLTNKGTLFVCTSFEDYGRYGTPFIREDSPSRLGAFSEYVRTRPDAVRSMHPLVSVTGLGPAAMEICGGAHYDGFGYDSPWGRLHCANAKLMTLGMGHYPEMGLTFLHYIEKLYGVPYQYTKVYNAPVYSEGQLVPGPFTMSVRYLDFSVTYHTNPFRDYLVTEWGASRVPVAGNISFALDADTIVEAGIQYLRNNRYGFLLSAPTFRAGEIPMDGVTGQLQYVYDKAKQIK